MKTNKLIKRSKVSALWATLAYILSKGEFALLSKYRSQIPPLQYPVNISLEAYIKDDSKAKTNYTITQAVNTNDISYLHLIQGLCG